MNGREGSSEWSSEVDHHGGPPVLTICVGGFIWISCCVRLDVRAGSSGRVYRGEWTCE